MTICRRRLTISPGLMFLCLKGFCGGLIFWKGWEWGRVIIGRNSGRKNGSAYIWEFASKNDGFLRLKKDFASPMLAPAGMWEECGIELLG